MLSDFLKYTSTIFPLFFIKNKPQSFFKMEIIKSIFYDYWYYPVIIILLFAQCSCDIQKEATKIKTETGFTENIESQNFRKGDTVHFEIPKITYKDTTIYRTNRQGTTIKTVYDQSGSIASIDCFASAIAEIRKENRAFAQSIKDKESKKTEDFDSSFILYIVVGIAVIVIFALFMIFLYINKNTSLVTQFLNK